MAAASERRKAARKKETDSKKYVWKKHTLWSYYFDGNVNIPEICIDSINLQCPYERESCDRLHSEKSWQWQLLVNNEWHNFLCSQSDRLERAFQHIDTNEVVLRPIDPAKTGKLGQELLELLGTESWRADFNQMKIMKLDFSGVFYIRRLSTPSSAMCKNKYSTEFRWYFQQDRKWVEFGQCIETDREECSESSNAKYQTNSDDIETRYQKDQVRPMTVSILGGKFKLRFSKMTLMNMISKEIVPVRRRPKNDNVVYPTVWSYQIQGDVDIAEICMNTIDITCAHKNGCGRLHANVPMHWQVRHNGIWYNMARSQVTALEKTYLDVWEDTAEIPAIEPSKMGNMGTALSEFLGTTRWIAEFDSMTITKLNSVEMTLPIRRLSTPTSLKLLNKFPTNFVWFFQNKEGLWVEFGYVPNTEDGLTMVSPQTTSYDIEKCYEEGNFDAMVVNIMDEVFDLKFSSMTLHNNSEEEVPVRRRPEHARSSEIYSRVKKNVALSVISKEYLEVKAHLLLSLELPEIVSIKRIQNPELWNVFRKRQEEVSTSYDSDVMLNLHVLFQWVKEEVVEDICNGNLEWKHQCPEVKAKCKNGVCFFKSAEFLHESCSSRPLSKDHRLIVFKVLVGKINVNKAAGGRSSSGEGCYTKVDNAYLPNIYFKKNKNDYCPAYIIEI